MLSSTEFEVLMVFEATALWNRHGYLTRYHHWAMIDDVIRWLDMEVVDTLLLY